MKIDSKALSVTGQLVDFVLNGEYRKATKYLSPTLVIKATLRGKRDRRNSADTVLVTVGSPNYLERQFIKNCKKAGEPFPVKKIQLKADKPKRG